MNSRNLNQFEPNAPIRDRAVVDVSNVKFPSDEITIELLRKKNSNKFDLLDLNGEHQPRFFLDSAGPDNATSVLGQLLKLERGLYLVSRDAGRRPEMERSEWANRLAQLYVDLGLKPSLEQGLEAVGSIVGQASSQRKSITR